MGLEETGYIGRCVYIQAARRGTLLQWYKGQGVFVYHRGQGAPTYPCIREVVGTHI